MFLYLVMTDNMCKQFYSSKQRNYATLSLILSELPKLAIVYHSPLSLQFNVTDKLWTIIGIFTQLNPETRKTPGKKYRLYKQIVRNPSLLNRKISPIKGGSELGL